MRFLLAPTMIFGEGRPDSELHGTAAQFMDRAIFPFAMPSIASPGAMPAGVVLTDNNRHSIPEQAVTLGLLLLVLGAALAILFTAGFLNRHLGSAGSSVISRVRGIILAADAVGAVPEALVEIGVPLTLRRSARRRAR